MKIRTTIRPDLEVEVDEIEYLDLKRQGLIAPEPMPASPAPVPEPASRPVPAPQPPAPARRSARPARRPRPDRGKEGNDL